MTTLSISIPDYNIESIKKLCREHETLSEAIARIIISEGKNQELNALLKTPTTTR